MSLTAKGVPGGLATLNASGRIPGGQLPESVSGISVADHGAVGDGAADDTAAIQSAIDAVPAAGGTVFVPAGTYKLTAALTLRPNLVLAGASVGASVLQQTSTTADCLTGTDVYTVSVVNLQLHGPGSGSGSGIKLDRSAEPNVRYLSLRDVYIHSFGRDGVDVSNAIASTLSRVVAELNGRYGIYLHGDGAAGTSTSLVSCYGNTNTTAGIVLDNMAYSALVGCASEGQPTNYLLTGCQSVSLSGCGSELVASSGTGFKIDGGFSNSLISCWDLTNRGVAYWITGGAYAINLIGVTENTPGAGATASLKVDSGCAGINLHGIVNTTALSLAANTTNILNDGSNGLTLSGGYVYMQGTGLEVNSATIFDQSATFYGNVGFFGTSPTSRPSLTYSRTGEPASAGQIRVALSALGLVQDATTA